MFEMNKIILFILILKRLGVSIPKGGGEGKNPWLTNSIILFYVWDGPDSCGFVGGTCNEMASSTITIAFILATTFFVTIDESDCITMTQKPWRGHSIFINDILKQTDTTKNIADLDACYVSKVWWFVFIWAALVSSLSRDKRTMGQAQNLAKGRDGPGQLKSGTGRARTAKIWDGTQDKTGQSRKGCSKSGKWCSKTEKGILKQERMF